MEPPEPAQPDRRPWYLAAFDRGYIERYAHRDATEARRQVGFLVGAGHLRAGCRLLDLCCGAGRHFPAVEESGLLPFGVDRSRELLGEAAASPSRGSRLLCQGDMRLLPYASASFGAVIQMFTAFGYFATDADNRFVLAEVARVLQPGGAYVLDLMNRDLAVKSLVPRSQTRREDGTTVLERRWFDPATERIEKRIEETAPSGSIEQRAESVRVFARDEISSWLLAADLVPVAGYGDFDGSAFRPELSSRMIMVAARK